jgi:His-Xaa-Ser system protein HxsD
MGTVASPVQAAIELDSLAYPLRAVQEAAYRFADRLHIAITLADDSRVRVEFAAKNLLTSEDTLRFIIREFQNVLLDQVLRLQIASETVAIRNLILAQAFSATSLLDPIGEKSNFRDDPLNIAKADQMTSLDGAHSADAKIR